MITLKRCYVTSKGVACATLAEAQLGDLVELLGTLVVSQPLTAGSLATGLMEHREELVAILKLKERKSRSKGIRATNGKPRKTRKIVPVGDLAPNSVPPVAA